MADRVVWTIADGVADVRLNRPDKLNALDMAMFTALADTAAEVAESPEVRAVVISGVERVLPFFVCRSRIAALCASSSAQNVSLPMSMR